MKRFMKKTIVWLVTFLMMFETCDTCIAYAANEIGDAIDPTRNIVLSVPQKYKDGGNWFFIAQADWAASEKSNEPMYIPIQRTGDIDSEADITLKVIDLSAKHDVNYKIELLKDKTVPTIAYADMSVKELAMNEDAEFTEVEPTDENGMGEAIHEMGGADIVDGSGTVIGNVNATPLDENGNPIIEEKADEEKADKEEADKEEADEEKADEEKADEEEADEEKADEEKADEEEADEEKADEEEADKEEADEVKSDEVKTDKEEEDEEENHSFASKSVFVGRTVLENKIKSSNMVAEAEDTE